MQTEVEIKVDILSDLVDEEIRFISQDLLEDLSVVKSFYTDLADELMVKTNFLNKLTIESIVSFYNEQIIPEQDIIDIFYHTTFSRAKMVDFFRSISFDSRTRILDVLKSKHEEYIELEKKIETKHQLISGVMMTDVSETLKENPEVMNNLEKAFEETAFNLDEYRQLIKSASRHLPEVYEKFVKKQLKEHKELFVNSKMHLSSQEEFSLLVKIIYLIEVKKDVYERYTPYFKAARKRFVKSVYLVQDSDSILLILNQLPDKMLIKVLGDIIKQTKVKGAVIRNKSIFLQKLVEKSCISGTQLRLKALIRNNNLPYQIQEESN